VVIGLERRLECVGGVERRADGADSIVIIIFYL
jgi:hypothetical protein